MESKAWKIFGSSLIFSKEGKQSVNGVFSDIQVIELGVPQGSVLGPILFLIYLNDFSNASSYFSTHLFADDTSLTVCGKDLDSLIHHINIELPKIYDWLCANKLTLNLTKTKYIIFQPRQKLNSNLHLPLVLAGQPLSIRSRHSKKLFNHYLSQY